MCPEWTTIIAAFRRPDSLSFIRHERPSESRSFSAPFVTYDSGDFQRPERATESRPFSAPFVIDESIAF